MFSVARKSLMSSSVVCSKIYSYSHTPWQRLPFFLSLPQNTYSINRTVSAYLFMAIQQQVHNTEFWFNHEMRQFINKCAHTGNVKSRDNKHSSPALLCLCICAWYILFSARLWIMQFKIPFPPLSLFFVCDSISWLSVSCLQLHLTATPKAI